MTGRCARCGHSVEAHQHYTASTYCAATVSVPDGHVECPCRRFRRRRRWLPW